MQELFGYISIIALFWFILYWVFGGVVFASIAILRVIKLRRARFSCFFTLASLVCAFGAAYSGTLYAERAIYTCLEEAEDVFDRLASVVACGILEQVAAGTAWFGILIAAGLFLFFISRASNQSWIDSDEDGTEKYDILEI